MNAISPISSIGAAKSAFVPCGSRSGISWHVVHTKPQHEVIAELQLRKQGWCTWLPLERRRLAQRHYKIAALFPRYLFVQFEADADPWGPIMSTRGVSDVLRSPSGRPLAIPGGIVEALLVQCAPNGVIYPPEDREMRRGDIGRVLSGPLADFRGICRRTSRDRVWLLLSVLGRETEVEFRREGVEIAS